MLSSFTIFEVNQMPITALVWSLLSVPVVLLYALGITSLGNALLLPIKQHDHTMLASGFVMGSLVIGMTLFALAQFDLINPISVILIMAIMACAIAYQRKQWLGILTIFINFFNSFVIKSDRYSKAFKVILIALIIWIFLLAITPARAADAMRYHLVILQDIWTHHGFVFRPYIHHNFPLYFGLLCIPLYMLFGGVGVKVAVCYYFIASLCILLVIAQSFKVHSSRLLLIWLFLTPMFFHEAHIALNDWVVVFYLLLSFFMVHRSSRFSHDNKYGHLLIGFLSFGFAMGVKYQAIIVFPWFIYYALSQYPIKCKRVMVGYALLCACMLFVFIPFYIRNWVHFSNPVWPLLPNMFPSNDSGVQHVAIQFQRAGTFSHSLDALFYNITQLIRFPLIPFTTMLLCSVGVVFDKKNIMGVRVGFWLTLLFWWLIQPKMVFRFLIYVLPIAYISLVSLIEQLKSERMSLVIKFIYALLIANMAYCVPLAAYYSIDYFKFFRDRDLSRYHQFTWYYDVYHWMNTHLRPSDHVLLLVKAGQSYYLHIPYERADDLSAYIDWQHIDYHAFVKRLHAAKINYILLDKGYMNPILAEYINKNCVSKVFDVKIKRYGSRLSRKFDESNVILYKINTFHGVCP